MSGGMDYGEFEKFTKNFQELMKDYDTFTTDFLVKEGMSCLADTKRNTPVDTGALRNNWKLSGPFKRNNVKYVVIHNNLKYASWVEDGHRIVNQYGDTGKFQPGRHMARKALINTELKLDSRFNRAFANFCKKKGIG